MWDKGIITADSGAQYEYCVKHYEEPSMFGIDEGRVSKLSIRRGDEEVYNYDRGLDIDCVDEETRAVLNEILRRFN